MLRACFTIRQTLHGVNDHPQLSESFPASHFQLPAGGNPGGRDVQNPGTSTRRLHLSCRRAVCVCAEVAEGEGGVRKGSMYTRTRGPRPPATSRDNGRTRGRRPILPEV